LKRVMIAGLMGGLVMIVWLIVVDGILGFKRGIDSKQIPEERSVYAFLAEHVKEPGRYVLNPEVVPEQGFPGDDPIFSVQYTGLGHDDAGQEMIVGLVIMLLSAIAGAWLVSNSSSRILSRYHRRVAFLAMIGVVVALLGIGARFGLAAYSFGDASALALHDLGAWIAAGLVMSWLIRPVKELGMPARSN
jgi:hypothetical protein